MDDAAPGPDHAQALKELNGFSVTEWSRWIRALLDGAYHPPELVTGHKTPDRILIWLFEEGLESTVDFVDAVGRVYEGSTPARPQQLYYLLQAVSVIRPEICKDLLLRHLKERRFDGVFYEAFDLKPMALATRARYEFTEELRGFVEHSAAYTEDFGYRLACFRTLADADPRDACEHMELLLPYLDAPREQKIFGGLLRGLVWAETHRPIFDWYVSPHRKRLAETRPDRVEALQEVLRRWVVPWRPSKLEKDPYGVLLSAHVSAGRRPFVAEELLFIARTATTRQVSDPRHVSDTLRAVWDGTHDRMADWCAWDPLPGTWQGCLPWMTSPEVSLLFTNWKEEALRTDTRRELFGQEILLDDTVDGRIVVAVSHGERALPKRLAQTEGALSFEDEFDRRFAVLEREPALATAEV